MARFRSRSKSVRGDRRVREALLNFEQQFPEAVKKALIEEAMDIFAESQEQVPVDTGRLQDSGVVGESPTGAIVIAYGTNYALPVHERTEVFHATGKAKYLEDPFFEAASGMERRLLARAKRHAGKDL